jgi:Ni/Co efflux regulator RcnB
MKRFFIAIALIAVFGALYAQDAADATFMDKMTATAADATTADATAADATAADAVEAVPTVALTVGTAQSDRYTVISELGGEDAQKLATTLEAYFKLYNSYFHFDATLLTSMLQARAKKRSTPT